jgi:ADP-ribose pyrophosphatase YjhB (NUDIX family)|tara:strand:+ start:13169 stop:13648 length:480 start_codon:yes stop_codon:yes gene_type:complete
MSENRLLFLDKAPPNAQIRVGVGALVIDKSSNSVLLEKRADCGLWGCPGGRIEAGENISSTAIREVKEETNVDIEVERIFGIYSDPQYGAVRRYSRDPHAKQIVDIYLLATPLSFEIKKSPESTEVKFFELDETPIDMVPYMKQLIIDYKKTPEDTILK